MSQPLLQLSGGGCPSSSWPQQSRMSSFSPTIASRRVSIASSRRDSGVSDGVPEAPDDGESLASGAVEEAPRRRDVLDEDGMSGIGSSPVTTG
ncbi:hypothetical protein [Caballeronia telluris]|uniref:hypothetical protein n=1 Tax=Caballeronia telluris TaxID=326475 RepID=UPI00135B8620|nr:hypothetical protein [Caballeronia telluris]